MRALGLTALLAFALLASSLGAAAGPVETANHWRNVASKVAMHQYEEGRDAVDEVEVPQVPDPQAVLRDVPGAAAEVQEEAERTVESLPAVPGLPALPALPALPGVDEAVAKAWAAQQHWRDYAWRVYQRFT